MQIPDESFSPDRHAESMIQDEVIQQALKEIPQSFREVVVLRDISNSRTKRSPISPLPMGTAVPHQPGRSSCKRC